MYLNIQAREEQEHDNEGSKQEISHSCEDPEGVRELWIVRGCKEGDGEWQYDDQDIERLSMIMTLHDIGFDKGEVEAYMRLMLEGEKTRQQRIEMLNQKRGRTLDEIHFKEKQIEYMDYLRYEMQNGTFS